MDYDVAVLGLATPPTRAVVTQYRPALSVRNNGIHDAIASGYLRIYSAGLLIFETEVYSGTLAPGATGTADAVDYWTPPTEGSYVVNGYATTPLDQYEPNNNLGPVTIQVEGGPTPPPPTVPLHAAQHEEGGTDPINVDGLPGVLADRQQPTSHAAAHQAGGSDALNVGSLQGVLAQDQPAQVHNNTRHSPALATQLELTNHEDAIAAHSAATNLANRELSGPELGLVPSTQIAIGSIVPASIYHGLRVDRFWAPTKHASVGYNQAPITLLHTPGAAHLLELTVPANWISDEMQFDMAFSGLLTSVVAPTAVLLINLYLGTTLLAATTLDMSLARELALFGRANILGIPTGKVEGSLAISAWVLGPATPIIMGSPGGTLPDRTPGDTSIYLDAEIINGVPGESFAMYSGYIRALHPIP